MAELDIEGLITRAKPPERSVSICLNADLTARHDHLQEQLSAARRSQPAAGTRKMAGEEPAGQDIAEQIRSLEEEMAQDLVTFRMRGLSHYKKHEWEQKHPPRKDTRESFNLASGPPALVAAACVAIYPAGDDDADHPSSDSPLMTEEQTKRLCERIGYGQTDRLFSAAWEATNGDGSVPYSAAASATIRGTDKR